MDAIIIGNMVWNGGLVAVIGYFGNRWMNKIEGSIEQNRTERIAGSEKTRTELRGEQESLGKHLEGIYLELKTANGRTAKIEGRLETQIAICEERHK